MLLEHQPANVSLQGAHGDSCLVRLKLVLATRLRADRRRSSWRTGWLDSLRTLVKQRTAPSDFDATSRTTKTTTTTKPTSESSREPRTTLDKVDARYTADEWALQGGPEGRAGGTGLQAESRQEGERERPGSSLRRASVASRLRGGLVSRVLRRLTDAATAAAEEDAVPQSTQLRLAASNRECWVLESDAPTALLLARISP